MTEHASEPDYKEFFDNAPCGYVLLSADGMILMANNWVAGLLEYEVGALDGMSLREVLSVAGRILYETNIVPLLTLQRQVTEVALDLKRTDGSVVPVIMSATSVPGASGRLGTTRIGFVTAGERRLYERELANAREEAERNLLREKRDGKLREQFVAVLGHDLRNPLASIAAATHMLEKETLSERGRQVLGLMQGSTSRMSGLIDDVLDFARARLGGGMGIELRENDDLQSVLEQVAQELRSANPSREVQTTYIIRRTVKCDSGRIGQLASNLLGNALTHGDALMPVRLHAETDDKGGLSLSVANGGSPIPEQAMVTLFDPFVRGRQNGTAQGLGLGLFIASEIAKAHGGVLSVTSSENETRFSFMMGG